jgi:hypothetical protein
MGGGGHPGMGTGFQMWSALLAAVLSSRHTNWKSWGGLSKGMVSALPLWRCSMVAKVGGSYPSTMQSPAGRVRDSRQGTDPGKDGLAIVSTHYGGAM